MVISMVHKCCYLYCLWIWFMDMVIGLGYGNGVLVLYGSLIWFINEFWFKSINGDGIDDMTFG